MKNRYTTLDVVAAVRDLQTFIGMRVSNIYDVNSKTYLIKLQRPEQKAMIMFESGLYILSTNYDWDKSQFPSSFSMKLRKHVKQRRLEIVQQVGVDRVVDLGFGDEEARVHVIIELYDRGNILLTDHNYVILNILRPRTEKDTDVKLAVKNRYPIENARTENSIVSEDDLKAAARRVLGPLVQFGGVLVEHALLSSSLAKDVQLSALGDTIDAKVQRLLQVVEECKKTVEEIHKSECKGYITYKTDTSVKGDVIQSFIDYHPFRFAQCAPDATLEFSTFSEAVDHFLSKMTSQKAEQKVLNMEKDAMKKLENVKKDQEERIKELDKNQDKLKIMAERVVSNEVIVEKARRVILSALAQKLSWDRIGEMCKEAARAGDLVASSIVQLQLDKNTIVMRLADPHDEDEEVLDVHVDLALNAFQNSKKLFDAKKAAMEKKKKTEKSSALALKNAEAKAKATLENVRVKTDVAKTRKVMWFEKFLWFVSRDGLIVIAGRDAQQNELLVKRYLRAGDVYVHADVRGAASVIIRNSSPSNPIPPKTLTEAAQMAVCYSNAWDAKVVASAWWVNKQQVSRTAPSGEYLTPGSFMIRGKKNFMPASQLIMGLGIMFKLDDESVERRRAEKKKNNEEEKGSENVGVEEKEGQEEEEEMEDVVQSEESGDEKEDDVKEEDDDRFPDVQVPMQKLGLQLGGTEGEEYSIINVGPSRADAAALKEAAGRREREKLERERVEKEKKEKEKELQGNKPLNKRQKHKLDKIKAKYGDQDEEERELRMALLGSRGKKDNKVKVKEEVREDEDKKTKPRPERVERVERRVKEDDMLDDDDDEKEENRDDEMNLLEQLTGTPAADDVLMYAVVCVAPYQALADFKYKVKLTPGTGKRGKAAKSAIELFLRSSGVTVREESLLRALVGDEATARNVPGKVKVSAPQLHKK